MRSPQGAPRGVDMSQEERYMCDACGKTFKTSIGYYIYSIIYIYTKKDQNLQKINTAIRPERSYGKKKTFSNP